MQLESVNSCQTAIKVITWHIDKYAGFFCFLRLIRPSLQEDCLLIESPKNLRKGSKAAKEVSKRLRKTYMYENYQKKHYLKS